jgi:hypothetical protein
LSNRNAFATRPHLGGHVFLPQIEPADQLRVALRFLHRIEVLALEILDQRDFKDGVVVSLPDDHRRFSEAQQLSSAPTPLASDKFIVVGAFANQERLNDALGLDGFGQFVQGFGGELFARLKGRRPDATERNTNDPFTCSSDGFVARCGLLWRDRFWNTQQSAEASAQSRFSHVARVSDCVPKVNVAVGKLCRLYLSRELAVFAPFGGDSGFVR